MILLDRLEEGLNLIHEMVERENLDVKAKADEVVSLSRGYSSTVRRLHFGMRSSPTFGHCWEETNGNSPTSHPTATSSQTSAVIDHKLSFEFRLPQSNYGNYQQIWRI
jgi:hypothetical protein